MSTLGVIIIIIHIGVGYIPSFIRGLVVPEVGNVVRVDKSDGVSARYIRIQVAAVIEGEEIGDLLVTVYINGRTSIRVIDVDVYCCSSDIGLGMFESADVDVIVGSVGVDWNHVTFAEVVVRPL